MSAGSGFEQVGNSDVYTTYTRTNLTVARTGYLYIYVSNVTDNIDVFFDNLQVTHVRGPILEETEYYPFGLTMAGISSKALNGAPENKKQFNGIEHTTDLDLNQYDAFFRTLDPQVGRWWQIDPKPNYLESPYSAMGNNPITYPDFLGDTIGVTGSKANQTAFLNQINTGKTKFIIDKSGNIALKDPKGKVVGEFAKQIVAGINNGQKVGLDLVNSSNSVMIDQFSTGKVDMGDMLKGGNAAFKDNVLHFVNERFAVADYESNKATTSAADFGTAHNAGLSSEEKYLKELYPKATIAYTGEGYDNASLKMNAKTGTGSINYNINFTGVNLVFSMKVTTDAATKAPVASNVVLRYSFEVVK